MKNVKELGLELVEVGDNTYLVKEDTMGVVVFDLENMKEMKLGIIASLKPVEGLPLLVIEDEVEILAQKYAKSRVDVSTAWGSYADGYKKAKETYKYTEDDLRKLISNYRTQLTKNNYNHYAIDNEQIIKSLSQKELYVETCAHCTVCDKGYDKSNRCRQVRSEISMCCLRLDSFPKVENNKIKAVWK